MRVGYCFVVWLLVVVGAGPGCARDTGFIGSTMKGDVFVQADASDVYDILFVVDNSASMKPWRDAIAQELGGFLSTVMQKKSVNYRLVVTTTDYFADQGRLIANSAGQDIIDKSSPDAVGDFNSIISAIRDSDTSFWEQGLEASRVAIQKNGERFIRPGSVLAVLYITDADDYSCKGVKGVDCKGGPPENHLSDWTAFAVDEYAKFFKDVKQGGRVVLYPLVGTEQSSCKVAMGHRYLEVAKQVGGGLSGSICPQQFMESLAKVAGQLADLGICFKLSAALGTETSLKVFVDHLPINASREDGFYYVSQTNSVCFAGQVPKNGSVIEISYRG
ncbi:MAG: VWA domain-containing protein [Deltaproteobacteria bacterium]|nr:VWA domain-containing protein [Deltaproteobacteria bacterium]